MNRWSGFRLPWRVSRTDHDTTKASSPSLLLRDSKSVSHGVVVGSGIKFTLHLVAILPSKSIPRGPLFRISCCVKAIRNTDAYKIADDVAIMEIIPDKNLHSQASSL